MPVNRNALIRYKTIDACLQNRYRKWTLEDLIDACSDALYDYEGIHKGVSRRSVQMDIQLMRSEKLGYNAPIVVIDKKYYTYEDPKYSIANIPLTRQDLSTLNEVAHILRQFKGFAHFREVDAMVSRLQHKIHLGKTRQRSVIDFEKNDALTGLEHLEPLFEIIAARKVLRVDYQSFKAREAQSFLFHPHLLKEHRNRWFMLGLKDGLATPQLLSLDRIKGFEPAPGERFVEDERLDETWFSDIVGVTRDAVSRPKTVRILVGKGQAPYVQTKPLHHSQQLIERREDGSCVFKITVMPNFELEREILGFGEEMEVLSPESLRYRIRKRLGLAAERYKED